MNLLFCGDVVGKSGRNTISKYIPELRKKLALDCVVVNGENSARGFGITRDICDKFYAKGVDVITGGDHCFDQKEILDTIKHYPSLLRPANWSEKLPGEGSYVFETESGKKILVIHLLGQVFMKINSDFNPFQYVDKILEKYRLGSNIDSIIVDFHAEATSEAVAMGHHLDGRVSLVVGSHTHIPTADLQILTSGTAYQTDAGMCGDYNSVIGFDKFISMEGFVSKIRTQRMTPATGDGTLCGVYVETDNKGRATRVDPVRIGGKLTTAIPAV